MGLSAADLAAMRSTATSLMPDSATIARTNATVVCLVNEGTGQIRLAGLPTFVRIPEWLIEMPDGTDLRAGDTFTVATMGTYEVLEMLNPQSYSVSTTAKCVQTADRNGNAYIPSNQTVTFRNPLTGLEIANAKVLIVDQGRDLMVRGEKPAYDWCIYFATSLAYSDGKAIDASHQVRWSRFGTNSDGTVRSVPLSTRPRPHVGPLALSFSYFKESA